MQQEQRALIMMRKVLTSIIHDVTPKPNQPHPLAQETLNDIRQCLGYIATREKELQTDDKFSPYYVNRIEQQTISLKSIK